MTYSTLPALAGGYSGSPHLLVAIDYPAALALRHMPALIEELPKYLLAPEVSSPAALRAGPAPKDAADHHEEYRRAHQRGAGPDPVRLYPDATPSVCTAGHVQAAR